VGYDSTMARLRLSTNRARTLAALRRGCVRGDIVEALRLLKERGQTGVSLSTFYRWLKRDPLVVMPMHVAEVLAELHGYSIVLVRADRCAAHRGDST